MTIAELKNSLNGQYADCEVYRFTDNEHVIHADYIIAMNDVDESNEVCEYKLMGMDEYNHSVYARSSFTADFEDYFGSKDAKVLIIVLKEGRY